MSCTCAWTTLIQNVPSRQPTPEDWRKQGFQYKDALEVALKILVRDGHIEEQNGMFLMPK